MYVAWLFEYTNNMWYSYMYMYNYLISWEGATPILEVKRPLAKDDNSSEHMHKLLVVETSYNKSSGCPISVNTTGPLLSQHTGNHDQWGARGNCGVDESVHLLDLKVFTTNYWLHLLLMPPVLKFLMVMMWSWYIITCFKVEAHCRTAFWLINLVYIVNSLRVTTA